MSRRMRHRLAALLFAVVVVAPFGGAAPVRAQTPPASPPPVEAFFGKEAISEVKLSPSGRHLAMTVAGKNGRTVLAVVDVELAQKPLAVASAPVADIRSFEWVDDDWLVYNVIDLQSAAYDQSFGPGLFSVRRDGSQARLLVQPQWGMGSSTETRISANELSPAHALMTVLRDGSHDVIVGEQRYSNLGQLVSVAPKRLDVSTGRTVPLAMGAPANTTGWLFDRAGTPRAAAVNRDGGVEVWWRDASDAPWRLLQKSAEFETSWWPAGLDAAGRLYVKAGTGRSTSVLKRFDFDAGRPEAEPIVATPGFDFAGEVIYDTDTRQLAGVRVLTDAETTVWIDPGRKKLQALADARWPGRVNRTICARCDADGVMLVQSFGDHDPGTWSMYRPKTDTWTLVGSARPAIDPRRMADLDLHRIKARDGLELPVWVTRPKGATGPLPAVLLVHGGPWVRGVHWRWSADAQFLASRGYVVIEPEFRGSEGYGAGLFRAGWKHWGTTMQDDLADAVQWAAGQQLIDPARTCIAGASYGGYAALMAPIRYPEMFRCSVAWVAVSDPRLLFRESWNSDIGRQAIAYTLPTLIGDPVRDADMLKAAAPVERAAEFKIPLLLAYGREDQRVPLDHGDRMRAALKAAGRDPEFVVYDGEGHGFQKPENRFDFYTRVEKFLHRHLDGAKP